MKIAVYCTGGTKLGFGHFFRSKTFSKSAPEHFKLRLFPVVDAEDQHFFNELKTITSICRDEAHAQYEIKSFDPDIIVFDTVSCSDGFLEASKATGALLVSISPIFNQMAKIHYLFTRNAETPAIEGVRIYKGMQYAIFNENCRFISDEIYFHNLSREFLTVGLAMGGGDAPNKTLRILQFVTQLKRPCTFWVLLGEGYRHSYQDLVSTIRNDSNHEIILAKTNRSMWNVLSNCSIAILAGGLTTLEAVYAGLPTLNIFERDEHVVATGRILFDQGVAENVGLFNDATLKTLVERLTFFSENKSRMLEMRERSKGKIDKLGSRRIFDILDELRLEGR